MRGQDAGRRSYDDLTANLAVLAQYTGQIWQQPVGPRLHIVHIVGH